MIEIRSMGRSAVLAEFDDLTAVLDHFRSLDRGRLPGVSDIVPAARTILVRYDDILVRRDTVIEWIRSSDGTLADSDATEEIVLPVRYDGPDLADVAGMTGLSAAEVIAAHTASTWTVAFSGFAPGFGYLVGGDPRLQVSRRSSPRTVVPAGSVGLAGEFSGVYPRASPGGWQLIGTCATTLWDLSATPPATLRPGLRVRFTEIS